MLELIQRREMTKQGDFGLIKPKKKFSLEA